MPAKASLSESRHVPPPSWARSTSSTGAPPDVQVRLLDRVKALRVAAAVLVLGAHPDDEESGTIAYLSRRCAARTVYWSATRGEGGANRRGPERAEALGMVRTWESLEARSVDGGEVLYGPFYDFGFSKDGEDTLRRWGRDDVVREMVRAIRQVQPRVVVSRWSGAPSDGHGHHQAVGLVAAEALEAAADPTRYADLGLPAWRSDALYRSAVGDWQPGESLEFGVLVEEHERAGHLRIDTGTVDPVVGLTYQEQAHTAVNRHRSQGMGFVPEPGPYFHYYRREQGPCAPSAPRSFFDGFDPLLTGLADQAPDEPGLPALLAEVLQHLDAAEDAFRPDRPAGAVPALLTALTALRSARVTPGSAVHRYLSRRAVEVEHVVAACLHLRVECLVDRPRVTPGRDVSATVRVWDGGPGAAEVVQVELDVPAGWTVEQDEAAARAHPAVAAFERNWTVSVPVHELPCAPYWLRAERGPYRYAWPAPSPDLGQPLDEPLVWATAEVRVHGCTLVLRAPAVHRSGFPGGSRTLPLTVLPPLAVALRRRREVLPVTGEDLALEVDVTVHCLEEGGSTATLGLDLPAGWTVEPRAVELDFARGGEVRAVQLRVVVPAEAAPGDYVLEHRLTSRGRPCGVELHPVRLGLAGSTPPDEHTCVAEAHLVRPAALVVDLVDAAFVRTLRYAYVRGMDEQVLASLVHFDLDVTELSDTDLEYRGLAEFDAIVVGPNAYQVRPAARRAAGRLLDYVAEGGTLVVQYQVYGYDEPGLTPYPVGYSQPHDRVTDPDAPVELLDPEHPLLHVPNEIGPTDFDGWVHDRGMYFLGSWDRRYVPVLASHDAGELPREGGLLTTSYGRGTYAYVGYSLWRQIPAGVPGAVRLFANLLGLAEVRVRERMARLGAVELFAFMTDEQLYEAARTVSERWVDAGSYLVRQGEHGHELLILVDGEIEVLKETPGAPDRLLHLAGPGEALGELTLLADVPRSASLRARTDVVVLVLQEDAFDDWLRRHPDLSRRMLQRLAEKVVAMDGPR